MAKPASVKDDRKCREQMYISMLWLFSFFFLEKCPICLDHITGPRRLKCRHVFCSVCLQQALKVNNRCPVCQEPQGVLRGNQPRGEMTSYHESSRSLPGYRGNFKIRLQTTRPLATLGTYRKHDDTVSGTAKFKN